MIAENINKLNPRARVLIAPLDWGLGHATRCIPIINVLIEHNIEVFIASEDHIATLLKEEFPSIVILPLKGYRITYSRGSWLLFPKLLIQIPRVISSINHEKKWLKKIVDSNKIDAVIADNRFGLNNSAIPCVYITHQLFIETGNRFLNMIARNINYRFISKFNECWVPDVDDENNFAGKLSRPGKLPSIPVKYIGLLSRLKKIPAEKKISLLIILSGPEPQRTVFENILFSQLKNFKGTVALVRGLPGNDKKLSVENKNLQVYDHLPAAALNELMQQSENIVARSGYSTVMDLIAIEKKAILVPTPGQTEQEYIASWLMQKKIFYSTAQENFSLERSLGEYRDFDYAVENKTARFNKSIVVEWIGSLKETVTASQ